MIHILSWTMKKRQRTLSKPLHSKLKKIQGLAQKFKDSSRTSPKIQGLFKTVPTLSKIGLYFTHRNGPIFRAKSDLSDLQWFLH